VIHVSPRQTLGAVEVVELVAQVPVAEEPSREYVEEQERDEHRAEDVPRK